MCNEVGCKQATGDATLAAGKAFKAVLRQLDPIATRPTTGAWKNWGHGNASMDVLWGETVVDVSGWNCTSGSGHDAYHNANVSGWNCTSGSGHDAYHKTPTNRW